MKETQTSVVIDIKKTSIKTVAVTVMALILLAAAIFGLSNIEYLPLYVTTTVPEFIGCWAIALLSVLALEICPCVVLFRFVKPSFKLYALVSGAVAVVVASILTFTFLRSMYSPDLWGITDTGAIIAVLIAIHLVFGGVCFALSLPLFRAVKKLSDK